ncbi:MAG: hypoxanthine phosphoribosyltransferase [Saprospiraceae bacterium]|jgi:hypoxanthine phosphoribosyltransferase
MEEYREISRQQVIRVHQREFVTFLHNTSIQKRVEELGREIAGQYAGKMPLFLSILNGAFVFTADLLRACPIECEVAFLRMASYRGMHSTGDVVTVLGLDKAIAGRHVIIVEDIIDTGRTMTRLMADLGAERPASIAIAALLSKPDALETPLNIDFLGFEIPEKFVLGYGLDYDGIGRNLPDIYQLAE